MVLTDRELVLDLRLRLETPVVWLAPPDDPRSTLNDAALVNPPAAGRGALRCHPRFPGDVTAANEMLARLDGAIDLGEPFNRIREAIGEARKMGVTNR